MDSTQPGFLQSAGTPPLNDDQLQDLLQTWFVGLSGLAPQLVRARWQVEPLERPGVNETWLAFGIGNRPGDWDGYVSHQGANTAMGGASGADFLYTNEELEIECSAYGPESDGVRCAIWTGTKISQNLDPLRLAGMGFIEVGQAHSFGERIKQVTVRRVDFRVRLRRAVSLLYPVLDVQSAAAELILSDPLIEESLSEP